MILIEKQEILGWEHAIRGMRNPLNSWKKSDSYEGFDCGKCGRIEREGSCKVEGRDCTGFECYAIGPNDLDLMKRLRNAGTDHRKFMRMITVYVDITAPLYWWKEMDQYRVGQTTNSCSTMHKIHEKEFTLDDFSHEHLDGYFLGANSLNNLKNTINILNFWRDRYNETDEKRKEWFVFNSRYKVPTKKDCWWQMIQLLPSSYNQKRTVMLNYEVLTNMYHSRKNHKLDEWRVFCEWVETLPYSELITGEER